MSLTREIREALASGGATTRLIGANLIVFVVVGFYGVANYLMAGGGGNALSHLLSVPASVPALVRAPWTPFTYMFLHEGFLHILFNILWLYWFGMIFRRNFTDRQLFGLYLLGGLAGAVVYVASFNLFPVFATQLAYSRALGASASVMAIVFAAAIYTPNQVIHLALIGPVRLKWIALFMVVTDLLGINTGNSGGHLAHLGGALAGWLFVACIRRRHDPTAFVDALERAWRRVAKTGERSQPRMYVSYRRGDELAHNARRNEDRKRLDSILEKIKRGGYEALSKDEKDELFRLSNKRDL